MIYRPLISVLTVIAFSASRAYALPMENSTAPLATPLAASSEAPVSAVTRQSAVPLYSPVTCYMCRGTNLGGPSVFCGSDGNTYYNFEMLRCINMCQRTNVEFRYFGKCYANAGENPINPMNPFLPPIALPGVIPTLPTLDTNLCPCLQNVGNEVVRPFCADDGYTYNSEYEARCYGSCFNTLIRKVYDGPCFTFNSVCNCIPSRHNNPVCGSDGNTYLNSDVLFCSNYCNKQRVIERFKGSCRSIVPYSDSVKTIETEKKPAE